MDFSAANTALWSPVVQIGIIAGLILLANVLRRKIYLIRKTLMPTAVLAGFTDAFVFADAPFLFRDQNQAIAFTQSDICREHLDSIEDLGLYGLALASVGDRNFLTVPEKPITCLADMKDMINKKQS